MGRIVRYQLIISRHMATVITRHSLTLIIFTTLNFSPTEINITLEHLSALFKGVNNCQTVGGAMRKTAQLIIAGVDYELINSLTYSDDSVV